MLISISTWTRSLIVIVTLSLTISAIRGQDGGNEQTDDVVRIKTELVQTDVIVLDKKGRFVEGLRPDQFELSLDGKSQAISFFERVTTGSRSEAAQLAAASGRSSAVKYQNPALNALETTSRCVESTVVGATWPIPSTRRNT